MESLNRRQETKLVKAIVAYIYSVAADSGGGFVREDLLTRRWFKVNDILAHESWTDIER